MTDRPIITVPDSLCAASVVFYIDRVVANTLSPYSLIEQTFKWPGEQWRVDVTLANIVDKRTAGQWKAFLTALEGTYGMFYLGDPSAKVPVGVATGTPLVDGGGQSGNSLNIKGLTPGVTRILAAGDMVQIGTGQSSRLHMQMVDLDSDGSGNATLTLQPAIREAPNDNVALNFHDAKGVFRLSSNTVSWNVKPGPVWNMAFQAEEVVGA